MKRYVIMETSGLKVLSANVYNNYTDAYNRLKELENKYVWTKRYGRHGEVIEFKGLCNTYKYRISDNGDTATASVLYTVIES